MFKKFQDSLEQIKKCKVNSINAPEFEVSSADKNAPRNVYINFGDGTSLNFTYWRLTYNKKTISCFDHNQKYGGNTIIDSYKDLVNEIQNATLEKIDFNENGDLKLIFGNNIKIDVFNLTSYEDWILRYSNGAEEFSNHFMQNN